MGSSVGFTSSISPCFMGDLRSTALRRASGSPRCRSSRIGREDPRMTEGSIANTAQQEFWNNVAGPRWVGLGGLVERRVRAVNDLLLARSEVAAGESVLEIGCGTAAATVPFAKAVGERGRVVGVFFFQAEDGIRGLTVTGVQTCALPISPGQDPGASTSGRARRGRPFWRRPV